MRTNYYTIIAIVAVGLLVTSNLPTHAMEERSMEDKKMSDKMTDKKMSDKKMTGDKMTDKTMADHAMVEKTISPIASLRKSVVDIEKSLTAQQKVTPTVKQALSDLKKAISAMEKAMPNLAMSDKKMTDKKMSDKKMFDKMTDKTMADHAMADKKLTVGSFDLTNASPVLGSKDAKVSIIEFGDYQCPKCDQWFKSEEPTIKSQYITTNKANLYFVDFAWLGSDSENAAQASHCADEQGKFWQYHDTLYTNQGDIQGGWASNTALKKFAANIGLDTAKFNQCLDSGKHKQHVQFNTGLGQDNGVTATPVFFIVTNGQVEKIVGPQPASAFNSVIEKLLK
jgi:protein-disulfide isomerase